MAKKLEAHRTAFLKQMEDDRIDFAAWFLNMVVFPSLRDIAERIDAHRGVPQKRNRRWAIHCAGASAAIDGWKS